MTRLQAVPGWVRPPLRAVSRVEDFTLRLYGRTRSPELLGAWVSLSWLGADPELVDDDGQPQGPYLRGLPTHVRAFQTLRIADALAEGCEYPSASWWASRGIDEPHRLSAKYWAERSTWGAERAHAHGVRVALGWLLGELEPGDVELMAPIHDGDGQRIDARDAEMYAAALRDLVLTPPTTPAAPNAAVAATRSTS